MVNKTTDVTGLLKRLFEIVEKLFERPRRHPIKNKDLTAFPRPPTISSLEFSRKKFSLGSHSFWLLNLVVWLTISLGTFLAGFYFCPSPIAAFGLIFSHFILGLILTSGIRSIYQLPGLREKFSLTALGAILLLSLVGATLLSLSVQALVDHMQWARQDVPPSVVFDYRIKIYWLIFTAWGIGYYGVKAGLIANAQKRAAKRARARAGILEIQMLRSQIDPHFLFNSLNGIVAEIGPHPATAITMVEELADYLRYSLDHRQTTLTPLAGELMAMRSFLKIEQSRFADRLKVTIQATADAVSAIVPSFLLQPLVENAVKHGHSPESLPLEITIHVALSGDTLEILVSNSGHLQPSPQAGVGHSTLLRRLQLHYPNRHQFNLTAKGGIIQAQLILQGTPCSEF